MMKKLLGILVLGLLLINNANAKIVNLIKCYDIEIDSSFNKSNFKSWSISVNLDTARVVNKMAFTESYSKKIYSKSKFGNETFKITNYDDEFIYSLKRFNENVYAELTINFLTGEVFRRGVGHGMDVISYYQCNLKSSNDGNTIGGSSSGTAFFVSKKGHLLTNNHVVDGCSISKITYKDNDYDTKLIATDKVLDLALLKAEVRPKSFFNFSKEDAKKLNKVYVAGYPLGKGLSDDLKISSGIVSSLKGFEDNSNEIQIDAPINPGNSGGPIINENGDLIAIAVSGLAKDQTEGINFGIKSSAAELFLRSNKVTPKKAMYSGIKDNDRLLEILEQGTVYTYCNN